MQKCIIIYTILLYTCLIGNSQQAPLYSQYVLNEFLVIPAMAGIDGTTKINFTGRKQWIGWKYAPETYSASISTRVLKSPYPFISKRKPTSRIRSGKTGRVGLGASIINDKNGAILKTGINLSYAYHIDLYHSQLSLGLSFLLQQFKIDNELAQLSRQPGDPLDSYLGRSSFSPDVAFGVNYSAKKINLGLSAFQLFQSPIKYNGQGVFYDELKQIRYYYFLGTYINDFHLGSKWQYEPSLLIRGTETLEVNADVSFRLIYNREYWGGLSVRTTGDFVLLMGLKLNRFYFGYSFDYGTNKITRLSFGSHEAVIAIKIGDSQRRYRYWERY